MSEVIGQPATEPSLDDVAAEVARGILNQEEGTPRDEKGKFTKAEPEAEAKEEEPKEEAAEEKPAEEEAPEITPEPRRFKLKYKGEELEKEEEEVIALAQQGFDYTQKSQALAREKDELEKTVRSKVDPKLKEYETQLETYRQAVLKLANQEAVTVDLNELSKADPAKAQHLFFERLRIEQTLGAIAQEQEKVAKARQEEAQENFRKQAAEAVETLQRDVPGWGKDLYGKVLESGVKQYGFKAEEVNAITDPRAIKVLHDAMKYRELKAKPVEGKKVVTVPKVVKPGAAQEKPDPTATKWNEGMAKLKKSGRSEDAVELAKLLLAGEQKQQKQ